MGGLRRGGAAANEAARESKRGGGGERAQCAQTSERGAERAEGGREGTAGRSGRGEERLLDGSGGALWQPAVSVLKAARLLKGQHVQSYHARVGDDGLWVGRVLQQRGRGGGEAQGCQPPIERVCGEQRAGGEVHRARVGWRGRQQGVQGSASVLKSSFFVSTRTPSALDLGWIIAGAPGGGWVLGGEGA